MKLNKVRISLIFIAVLYIISLVCVVYWDVIRDQIIIPIYYLVWVVGLILNSISQKVFLIFLVAVCIVIGINTIIKIWGTGSKKSRQNISNTGNSRYRFWARLLNYSLTSEFFRWDFVLEARRLIFSIFSFQEGLNPSEVEQGMANETLPAPLIIKQLVKNRELPIDSPQRDWLGILGVKIARWLNKTEDQNTQKVNDQIEEIIHYIEERLEITQNGNRP
ncbi:MAG: hypothetical protein JW908_07005 [Anaerolineales bacterium]|nr:hypothetical protein [Anaerolineales bacterium]